ncbi:class I SAM-dependent methyltransferase [Demequina sp.]|uniref:class I SAM-dependent methyltransferase n=1 Tax=Demequina sp. TaxID=2050685 RepID=UPI003D0FC0B2
MTDHTPDDQRRNHTIDYFRGLLPLIPAGASTALDIGCGEGFAARALAARGVEVTAIDLDAPSLALAREQDTAGITYVEADFMTADLPGGYDVITMLAVLHHLPVEEALARAKSLLAPGGVLLVVGLAASELPKDGFRELAAVVAHQAGRLTHKQWEQPSPTVWPPPVTYSQVKDAAASILPGSSFKRRVKWRYTLTWVKPTV